jgi:FeS assembly protein IscX
MNTGLNTSSQDDADALYWDDSYAIARELARLHPETDLANISIGMIYQWTIELPGFKDEKSLANEAILASIYQEWYEEVNPI